MNKNFVIFILFLTIQANDLNYYFDKGKEFINDSKRIIFEKKEQKIEYKRTSFNKIWEDIFPELEEGVILQQDMLNAPENAWFSTDKGDIKEDLNDILNSMYSILIEDNILKYKKDIEKYEKKINDLKKDIQKFNEEKILAPEKSIVKTTKKEYEIKIAEAKREIKLFNLKIELIKKALLKSFRNSGISISDEEAELILIGIEGDDRIQRYLILDIINKIMRQISKLMENKEELSLSKKYYGMDIVSRKLLLYIYKKYKSKIKNNYLVKLHSIREETIKLLEETKMKIKNENDEKLKREYQNNVNSQKKNLECIDLYSKVLDDYLSSLNDAVGKLKKQISLSINTFKTVSSSSNLYTLMEENMSEYNKIMIIQIPDIRPFKNSEIREQYKKLTKQLKNKI